MSRIVRVKNTGANGTFGGHSILSGAYYDLTQSDLGNWANDEDIFAAVADSTLIVNKGADGVDDIANPIEGWRWLIGDTLPISRTNEGKLAVHSSSKPEPAEAETFAVWAGSGDDVTQADPRLSIGAGDLLTFDMNYNAGGSHVVTKDVKFDPRHGRVWIHEAYIKFENGGVPDFLNADIMAPATALQQAANLDLIVTDNWVLPAPGGPGTGTHGFAATPTLMPRAYSKDGHWDYDGTNLIPNLAGTGGYRISDIDRPVHRYFNKIPLNGSSTTYFTMSSDETAELRVDLGYFVRINVHNNSNSNWQLSVIMEIFRERTIDP